MKFMRLQGFCTLFHNKNTIPIKKQDRDFLIFLTAVWSKMRPNAMKIP